MVVSIASRRSQEGTTKARLTLVKPAKDLMASRSKATMATHGIRIRVRTRAVDLSARVTTLVIRIVAAGSSQQQQMDPHYYQ